MIEWVIFHAEVKLNEEIGWFFLNFMTNLAERHMVIGWFPCGKIVSHISERVEGEHQVENVVQLNEGN